MVREAIRSQLPESAVKQLSVAALNRVDAATQKAGMPAVLTSGTFRAFSITEQHAVQRITNRIAELDPTKPVFSLSQLFPLLSQIPPQSLVENFVADVIYEDLLERVVLIGEPKQCPRCWQIMGLAQEKATPVNELSVKADGLTLEQLRARLGVDIIPRQAPTKPINTSGLPAWLQRTPYP